MDAGRAVRCQRHLGVGEAPDLLHLCYSGPNNRSARCDSSARHFASVASRLVGEKRSKSFGKYSRRNRTLSSSIREWSLTSPVSICFRMSSEVHDSCEVRPKARISINKRSLSSQKQSSTASFRRLTLPVPPKVGINSESKIRKRSISYKNAPSFARNSRILRI